MPPKAPPLLLDLHRYTAAPMTPRKLLNVVARYYGAQATLVFRFGKALARATRDWRVAPIALAGWPIYLLLRAYVRYALGIRLDLSAEIGPGLYIGHFGNIHLTRCKLGCNCSIAQSTQIMPAADGAGPMIGDRVWIGAHARIIGAYSIGSGSTLSAGAVIRRDIPAGALCLGDPARIVARQYDNRSMLGLTSGTGE